MDDIQRLREIISGYDNIVFFGGAGVSTESGIPDFRSSGGLYRKEGIGSFTPEEMISHSFFVRYPEDFYRYYKEHLVYPQAKPNEAHKALAELERRGRLKAVVTQNIDGLHQKAGSKVVYELHGSVLRNYCMKCHRAFDAQYILDAPGVPCCDECGGMIKPDVVLYEESLDMDIFYAAQEAVAKADTLIIGGTSLVVYPAAGMVDVFRGNKLVIINKSVTPQDNRADLCINAPIGHVLGEAIKGVF